MKFFLDSAKLDEIKYAYNTFGIDGDGFDHDWSIFCVKPKFYICLLHHVLEKLFSLPFHMQAL